MRYNWVNGLVLHFVLRLSVEGKAWPEGSSGLNGFTVNGFTVNEWVNGLSGWKFKNGWQSQIPKKETNFGRRESAQKV